MSESSVDMMRWIPARDINNNEEYLDCNALDGDSIEEEDPDDPDSSSVVSIIGDLADNASQTNAIRDINVGKDMLIAGGIFAIILISGNYVFNKIPSNKLQKAIDKDRFT